MFSKIKKPLLIICLIAATGLLTCGLAYAKANLNPLQFVGKDNTIITLLTNDQNFMNGDCMPDSEAHNLEVGQVIESNGEKEIVFAIRKDGSYITIPASE